MPKTITNQQTELERGKRYLLFFQYRPLTADIARKLSDNANIRATFLNKFAGSADIELQGSTIQPERGQFIVLVRVKGTPLLAAIAPIVAIVLIVTAGVAALVFIKAVLVEVGGGLSSTLESIGEGVEEIGKGAGKGLAFGLPAIGIAAGIAFVLFLVASLSLPITRRIAR